MNGLELVLDAAFTLYQERWGDTHNGDDETPNYCEQWADECQDIYLTFSDFHDVDRFAQLSIDLRTKAAALRKLMEISK